MNQLINEYKDYIAFNVSGNTPISELRGKMVLVPENLKGKGTLPDGYRNPIEDIEPLAENFYNSFPSNFPPDLQTVEDNFIKANNSVFAYSETNVPALTNMCNSCDIFSEYPEYYASKVLNELNDFLTNGTVGSTLKSIGVVNIDFTTAGPGVAKDLGQNFVHNVVQTNFK